MTTPPPDWQPDPSHPPYPAGPPSQPGYPDYSGQPAYPGRPGGGLTASTDPLVATDFGGWFSRVYGVIKRSFLPLAIIWIVPTLVLAAYFIVLSMAMPGQQELAAQIQADPYLAHDQAAAMSAAGDIMVRRLLPIILVFVVVSTVTSAFAQGASLYVVVREANGQSGAVGEALRFACGRVLPLLGWSIIGGLITTIGFILVIVPGLYLSVVIMASLLGVVVIERTGIRRCFQLIKGRFWDTTGRLMIAFLITMAYTIVTFLIFFVIGLLAGLTGMTGLVVAVVGVLQAASILPMFIFFVAVYAVTYAELRHRENPEVTTATLAAEMTRA